MRKEHVTAEVALLFDDFWSVYPKRSASGKYMAKQIFNKLVTKEMVAPEKIINGARHYAEYCAQNGKLNTEYVAMAKTWLNQRRWEDGEKPDARIDDAEFARLKMRYEEKVARNG